MHRWGIFHTLTAPNAFPMVSCVENCVCGAPGVGAPFALNEDIGGRPWHSGAGSGGNEYGSYGW